VAPPTYLSFPSSGWGTPVGAKLQLRRWWSVRTYKCTAEGGGATQEIFSWFPGGPAAHEELSYIFLVTNELFAKCGRRL
jgi:hypothetical protein